MQGSFPALPPSLMMFLGQNIKGGGYMNSITDLLDLEDNDDIGACHRENSVNVIEEMSNWERITSAKVYY